MKKGEITPEMIRELRLEGRLVPFIGAGLSKNLGLPDWEELVQILADDLDLSPKDFDLKGEFLQLAEYYLLVKGNISFFKKQMHKFLHPADEAILNSEIYNTLVDLDFPIIYTTNFDDIIERAYQLKGLPYHAINGLEDLMCAPPKVTQIVKIHGTYTSDSNIVLAESHYFDRLEFDNALDIKFKHDLMGSTIMFLGYSFRDINIRYRIYEMMKYKYQVRKRLTVDKPSVVFVDFNIGPVRKKVLSSRGIHFHELVADNKGNRVAEFLNLLK